MRTNALMLEAVLLLALLIECANAKTAIALTDGQKWGLVNGNGSVSTSTTLPAYPLEVLRAQGIIADPLYRYGELTSRWVALDNWTFTLNFSTDTPAMQELLSEKQVLLKFYGIDTFAEVTLNGQHILSANNFHRHWAVPVKDLLVDGENQLQISIRPAMQESLKLKEEHPYNVPLIHQMGSVGAYNFVRKPASDLGWDWGPAYAASGIHGGIELIGFSNAHLDGAYISQRKLPDAFELTVTSQLLPPPGGDEGELSVAIPELDLVQKQPVVLDSKASTSMPTELTTKFIVNASSVALWWPVGYGQPNLYNVTITYTPKAAECSKQENNDVPEKSARSLSARAVTSPDGAFRILPGFDLPGEAFEKKEVASMDECHKLCKDTAGCSFYTYATPPENFCWLKKLATEVAGATFAVKLDDGIFDVIAGQNLAGFDLGAPVKVADVDACRKLCSAEQGCHMLVFLGSECHLKAGKPSSLNRLVGVKLSTAKAASSSSPLVAAPALVDANPPAAIPRPLLMAPDVQKPTPRPAPAADLGGYGDSFWTGSYGGYYGGFEGIYGGPSLDELLPSEPGFSTVPGAPTVDEPAVNGGDGAAACAAAAISQLHHRIGFRTVELVRLPIKEAVKDLFPAGESGWDVDSGYGVTKSHWDGSWALSEITGKWEHFPKPGDQPEIEGESFYFKVNGIPIYIKGANLVPLHILPTNVTKEVIHDVLNYALESNMNMIRVWGGGMYPHDDFFTFCDEKGLMVWMETMFACAPYPRDPDFLENVAAEVTQQVQRLTWHPSVGVWAGNNEIEGSLNWYSESRTNRQLFAGDYIALFIDTIRNIIRKTSPTMAFVDSSPSNGAIVDDERQYIKRWGEDWDPRYGDVHHYAYEADCEDYSTYPKAKFISEFGSQSYPTFATYAEATMPIDWQVNNQMTGFRNRRFGNGLEVFEAQFKRHFRLPDEWSAPNNPQEAFKLFRSFMYITHMQQARCYEAAINYWRRLRSQPAGLTMGVLYWQLNDIAEFASWSSYDYGGRWKPLAYAVKRMYAPLQVQIIKDGSFTKVFVVNDHTKPLNVSLTVKVLSLQDSADSCTPTVGNASGAAAAVAQPAAAFDTVVPPGFASMVWTMPTASLLAAREDCSMTSCYLEATASSEANPGQSEVSESQLWLVPLKDVNFPDPGLALSDFTVVPDSVIAGENSAVNSTMAPSAGAVSFTVKTTRAAAALTNFNTKLRGRFSDDAFTALHPCQPKTITFYPHASVGPLTPEALAADLIVESLYDHQFGEAA